ncbi:MAG: hypothetical protein GEU87_17650 [Alphaproteobacteria bacterium]|nr:hypothetical protein [Alphaproteobacteria bacterium]
MTGVIDFLNRRFSADSSGSLRNALLAAAMAALSACQAPAPSGPEGSWSILPAGAARLTLNLAGLPGEARHARFRSADGRYVEETAQWGGDSGAPSAGVRLSEASPGPPLTDPDGPNAIIPSWTALQDKRPAFTEPGSAQAAFGPVSWWRASLGTAVCVLFLHRLPPQQTAAATLSGYYCNPPGSPLSSDAAVTVVQSIGLRPRPEGQ